MQDVKLQTISTLQAVSLAFGSSKKEDFKKFLDMLDLKQEKPLDLRRELLDSGIYEEK